MKTKKTKKPTIYQTSVLKMIARSRLIKTLLPERQEPFWHIDGMESAISHQTAQALIRNGWLIPQRDGLSMFDESQTYVARTP